MNDWHEKYLGLPFKAKGRDFDGVDCAGLFILVLRHERGIEVWDCAEAYSLAQMHTLKGLKELDAIIRRQIVAYTPVGMDDIQPFDFLLYTSHGVESHCAVAVDSKHVLTIEERHTSHLGPIHLPGYVLSGVYRYGTPAGRS